MNGELCKFESPLSHDVLHYLPAYRKETTAGASCLQFFNQST